MMWFAAFFHPQRVGGQLTCGELLGSSPCSELLWGGG
jgi:hypothetical protein